MRMKVKKIVLTNRTKEKAENLKKMFKDIEIMEWGKISNFDMIINATSVGLKDSDKFDLDFSKVGSGKFFYDIIYQPFETEFSKAGNMEGNKIVNGLSMFLFQAQKAFNIWHNLEPNIDENLKKFLMEEI